MLVEKGSEQISEQGIKEKNGLKILLWGRMSSSMSVTSTISSFAIDISAKRISTQIYFAA